MKCAVFNRDGDLVTVVDVPAWAAVHLKRHYVLTMAAIVRVPFRIEDDPPEISLAWPTINLRALNRQCTALECDDDELALTLPAVFAAGQQAELNRREKQAEYRGGMKTIRTLKRLGRLDRDED
jgi:hypothetical protein